MADIDKKDAEVTGSGMDRRQFVTGVGGAGVGLVIGGLLVKGFILPDEVFAMPASEGYLVIDTKKCASCSTCMMACSTAHHGQSSYSLSRIQVVQDSFTPFPGDVQVAQCRQCPYPPCVDACPTGANHVDTDHGNVRTVDASKCIGCERCVMACPFTPSRALWNHEDKHAQKCDLCSDTPYWDEEGGIGGKQACVEMCPMGAIGFVKDIPVQSISGYEADLGSSSPAWVSIGFTGVSSGLGAAGSPTE